MERKEVSSSQIKSIGYDAATKTLEVEFNTGGVYQYDGVPAELADEFVRAESVGRFFGQHIRGKFDYRPVAAA